VRSSAQGPGAGLSWLQAIDEPVGANNPRI